ncbi:hypothetical protein BD410DRAFT_821919 [Rickenella mellea]|uniref:EF-hand domain-containing protein n=1 Tax=Rickenella mellea TaxID=50990 RepID=A0A4Y7PXJ0_9AGAM|nr:hypothetical protein BD410DRAFT_821919 [Rickenella mellea]
MILAIPLGKETLTITTIFIRPSSDTDATQSSEEFDWEAEESEDVAEANLKARRGRKLWTLFMRLARPIRTFLVAILGGGLIITPLLIFQFRFHNSSVRPHVHTWSLWLAISWAAGSFTHLVVDLIPRIVICMTMLFHGHVERLKIQLELVLAVSGWIKLALDITWSWIALSVIRDAIHPPGTYWVIVNRVMQALFSAGLILLLEKIFLRFVAIRFHQKALADRLAENKLALRALDRLSNADPSLPRKSPFGTPKKYSGHKSPSGSRSPSVDLLSKDQGEKEQHSEKISHSTVVNIAELASSKLKKREAARERKQKRRRAMAAVIVDQVGDAIGQVALKDSKFNKKGKFSSMYSARRLARQLFATLGGVYPPRSHLIVEDFYPYFRSTADAETAFAVFDKDNNGDITKKEMREAVQRIYRDRRALTSSLKDVGSAVAKLDAVLVFVALTAVFFLCLLIFNPSHTIQSLVPLATIILGFSFIFGNSAKTLFESLIFIFSTHVFDVGDLVMIDDQPLFVREFGLFSTTFTRVDGQEVIAPNSLLAGSKLVHNLRRSSSMWETTKLMISYDTPLEIVEQLRGRLQSYVAQNNREWSNVMVNIEKMEFQNAIHLIIAMEHRPNWQDWGGRWTRRTAFMRNLKTVLEELDVTYSMPVQPVLLPKYSPYPNPNIADFTSATATRECARGPGKCGICGES